LDEFQQSHKLWYQLANDSTPPHAKVCAPNRWGLSVEAIAGLGCRLYQFWQRFRGCFKTRTRDTSPRAYDYLRAQLTMETERNFANIDRTLNDGDGQALEHFMAHSPWSAQAVFQQIQAEIKATPALAQGNVLILDESADEKAGNHNAGASRQYNGRMGKVDLCRVDTGLALANPQVGLWTLVDGELFLREEWLSEDFADKRRDLGLPPDRQFETKLELGLKMVKRAQANGLPFERLACDTLYGRDHDFRADLNSENVRYAAQVPSNTHVYLREPKVGIPSPRSHMGRPYTRSHVLSCSPSREVRALTKSGQTQWQHVQVRPSERGWVEADFAVRRVWTVPEQHAPQAEWLVIRRDASGECTYTLLNDPEDTSVTTLIHSSCLRYFCERTFEDAKTEIGWAEFQAQKYRAWEHHLALTALSLWFVAQTKLEWTQTYARDPELLNQFELQVLPALSTANVRTMLMAVLPLPDLTPERAADQVVAHLVNRARSTSSRLKSRNQHNDSS
jgi:SRSO17 transposase